MPARPSSPSLARSALLAGSLLAAAACGGDALAPLAERCATRHGVEVCVERLEYRQLDTVTFTARNVSGAPIFLDACGLKPVGVTALHVSFEEVYNPSVHCGRDVTREEIVDRMTELAPGDVHEDSVAIRGFAFQGYYRVNVWILDATGALARPTPAFSAVFTVFPHTEG